MVPKKFNNKMFWFKISDLILKKFNFRINWLKGNEIIFIFVNLIPPMFLSEE